LARVGQFTHKLIKETTILAPVSVDNNIFDTLKI
jgi:hypothetical protein